MTRSEIRLIILVLQDFIDSNKFSNDASKAWNAKRLINIVNTLKEPVKPYDLLMHSGGNWLGVVRKWIQSKYVNGDKVAWGSSEIHNYEVLAAEIAAAAINEYKGVG